MRKDFQRKTGSQWGVMGIKDGIVKLACSALICISLLSLNASSDEIGLAIGFNASSFKSFDSDGAQYQKTDYFNPIEINFQKEFNGFIGFHSALQYAKRSTSESIQSTRMNSTTRQIEPAGILKFERSVNYISLEACPILFRKVRRFTVDGRVGLSGDIYINEWINEFGIDTIVRSSATNPFVLSFVGGVGIGYTINEKFKVGLRSSISISLTDIDRNQAPDSRSYFVNFHDVIFASMIF